ncbi:MAG TPA: hypothetical protein DIT13_06260 [Verrucomicrobiales bacterium]|nr:hypothetical protein [Verrucomicrobiales bacterium]HRJ10744.1 DUF4058 family protein [Prosthecobacter sp.]HRK14328.1 DUF4058 family protein [Prosthecobacter sp.]
MNKNPFPGMNPFMEALWPDIHTALIGYIRDSIAEQLPPDLNARSEESVTLHDDLNTPPSKARADVAVTESWRQGIPPSWNPAQETDGPARTLSRPQIILVEEEVERWIEITDRHGLLITVIEVLSPANKGAHREEYRSKRDAFLHAGVNVVEIDLLHQGRHTVAVALESVRMSAPGQHYLIRVTRATRPSAREVYAAPLREPLPVISIPLRAKDKDAVLALQPLVDRCYRMGAYWNANHDTLPEPAPAPDDEEWIRSRVKAAREQAAA